MTIMIMMTDQQNSLISVLMANNSKVPCPCLACNGQLRSRPTRIAHMEGRGGTLQSAVVHAVQRAQHTFRLPSKRKHSNEHVPHPPPGEAAQGRSFAPESQDSCDQHSASTGIPPMSTNPSQDMDCDPSATTPRSSYKIIEVRNHLERVDNDSIRIGFQYRDLGLSDNDTSDWDDSDNEDFWGELETDSQVAHVRESAKREEDELLVLCTGGNRDHHAGLLPSEVVSEKWQVEAMNRRKYSASAQ